MNQQTYRKITDGIRGLENGEKIVQFINSIATKIIYGVCCWHYNSF